MENCGRNLRPGSRHRNWSLSGLVNDWRANWTKSLYGTGPSHLPTAGNCGNDPGSPGSGPHAGRPSGKPLRAPCPPSGRTDMPSPSRTRNPFATTSSIANPKTCLSNSWSVLPLRPGPSLIPVGCGEPSNHSGKHTLPPSGSGTIFRSGPAR